MQAKAAFRPINRDRQSTPSKMTSRLKIPLRTGPGWKEVAPRPTPWRIAWEGDGRIQIAPTSFETTMNAGPTGAVEAPLAYDAESDSLFRYYCPSLDERNATNALLRIDPHSGRREHWFTLHPLRTLPWLLAKVPNHPLLIALVVTDTTRPDRPGIVLQHQLGLFHLAKRNSVFRNLPAGCQHPIAAAPESDRLLFHGPDGFQIVNLKGKRQLLLSSSIWGKGHGGGAFHPRQPSFAIGGLNLSLYEPSTRQHKDLVAGGCFPSWHPSGETLFCATSSSDLWCIRPDTMEKQEIVSIPANRYPELKRARPVEFSPDGRYFALPITRRAPFHAETVQADQPAWSERQCLLIGDLNRQEIWQNPSPVSHCTWAGRSR